MRNDTDVRSGSGEVGVLHKTLDLLEALAGIDDATVAELAGETGVNRAAAYRILNTLERRGYVVRNADDVRRYSVGPALRTLARDENSPGDLLVTARPHLRSLWEEFGETVNLGVLSDDRVLYLDILESDQGLRTTVEVGSYDAVHATALGKAMLAALTDSQAKEILQRTDRVARTPRTLTSIQGVLRQLPDIRRRGYALDDEENETGARCVAAAVTTSKGAPRGALSISAPAWRMPDDVVKRMGARLRQVCDEAAERLG
jgi:IclR family transcriptional regulator, acetate operon repressor